MTWETKPADGVITFECDSCGEGTDLNFAAARAAAKPEPQVSDFIIGWRQLEGRGWRSFKRTGREWSYHCPRCGDAAEAAHHDWRKQEEERDRIKARNGR